MKLDWPQRRFTVVHDPERAPVKALLAKVESGGYEASLKPFPASAQGKELTTDQLERLDVKTITHGEPFSFDDHKVAGKITIFDYYADWCGPCLILGRKLEALAVERGDLAIRKCDLVTWKSKLAKQLTRDYELPAIPYLRIYGPKGELLGTINKNDIAAVKALLPPVKK